jgi:four helix bundle protein
MDSNELKERTKRFALNVIRLASSLPKRREAEVIARQIIRSATSLGANYRSACRARSKADFVSKIGLVEEEVDETLYWLELLVGANIVQKETLNALLSEANELVAIFTATGRTARLRERGRNNPKSTIRDPK